MIRPNIWQTAGPSRIPLWTAKPMIRRVHWSMTTMTQCEFRINDSQRNRSTLHRLSLLWPRKVSQDGPLESGLVDSAGLEPDLPYPCRQRCRKLRRSDRRSSGSQSADSCVSIPRWPPRVRAMALWARALCVFFLAKTVPGICGSRATDEIAELLQASEQWWSEVAGQGS